MHVSQLLWRYLVGDRDTVAGTVYGTIVVLSVLAAGAHATVSLNLALGLAIIAVEAFVTH